MLKPIYLLASVLFATACQPGQLTSVTLEQAVDGGTPSDSGLLDSASVMDSAMSTPDLSIDSSVVVDSGQTPDAGTDAGTDTGPVCEPSCGSATCGDDGCGGSCGSCASGVCTAGQCQIEGCPPTGPFGTGVGQTAPNITLYDCDDNPVELNSQCGNRVTHLYGFAEWCGACVPHLRNNLENQHNAYAAMGDITTWVVVTAVTRGSLDAAGCRRVRDYYGIDTPGVRVLYDPRGETASVLGFAASANDFVMSRYNKIWINQAYAGHIGVPNAFANTTP